MNSGNQLKNLGINHLKSYFSSDRDKKLIQQKFTNISGKTGQYSVPDTLYQKRTPRKNRILIPFEHVHSIEESTDVITYEQLNTFEGGVAVEFVNNDFFSQLELPEEEQSEVFKILKDKLGSDDNVSAVITIRSTGDASSQIQRESLLKLNTYLEERNLNLVDALIKRKEGMKYKGQGNEQWEGFVYYSIRGGQQDATDSHIECDIESNNVQLFNPSVEYAGEQASLDITLVLIYFALYSVQIDKRDTVWNSLVSSYLEYFNTRIYDGKNLKDYVTNHISLKLEENKLTDPIQVSPIYIEDFAISIRTEDSLDITHQSSVNRRNYTWDEDNKILLTPARPTNLFWSKHLSNMMQQDFSLKEYFIHQREIMRKWDEFGIDNIEEY